MDGAPDLTRKNQGCEDGAACDFDQIPGRCTFRVGVCLNRTGIAGCTPGNIQTFELRKVNLAVSEEAAAAAALTAAVIGLATPGSASAPDRCREGVRHKLCSIPANLECDTSLGAGNGVCDIGTGVVFSPPLDTATQLGPCTEPVDVIVPVGGQLRLKARTARTTPNRLRDSDVLQLSCRHPTP